MAQTLAARLRSRTAQARRSTRAMRGATGGGADLAAALASVVKLLETVHERPEPVGAATAADLPKQQQRTGVQRNRDIADRARRSLKRRRREQRDPPGEHEGTGGRAGAATGVHGTAGLESPRIGLTHPEFADSGAERDAAIQYIGTYYGTAPANRQGNNSTRDKGE